MKIGKQLKNLFRRLRSIGESDALKIEPRPTTDWQRLIATTFFLLVLVFAGYYYLLFRLRAIIDSGPDKTPSAQPVIDREKINRAAAAIDTKTEAFTAALSKKPAITDPAL